MKRFNYYKCIMTLICFALIIQGNIPINAAEKDFNAINVLDSKKVLNSVYESQNNLGGDLYCSVAFDFHIFSNEATITAHTNGNVATNIFNGNGNSFGGNHTNYLGKREDNYFGQEVNGLADINSNGYIVLGSGINTKVSTNSNQVAICNKQGNYVFQELKNVYKQTETSTEYIDITKELNNLANMSKILSEKESSDDVELSKLKGENQTINITKSNKINYLNIKASDISDEKTKRNLFVNLPKATTLIINVDMNGVDINYLQNLVVKINNYSSSESLIKEENGLLWNLYDSSKSDRLFTTNSFAKIGLSDYFMGTILAPKAKIAYGALNGSVIADQTKQEGKESHRWDFTGLESFESDDSTIPNDPTTPTDSTIPNNSTKLDESTQTKDSTLPKDPTIIEKTTQKNDLTKTEDSSTVQYTTTNKDSTKEENSSKNDDPTDSVNLTKKDITKDSNTGLGGGDPKTDGLGGGDSQPNGLGGGDLPPSTSDNFNLLLFISLFIISGIGLCCYVYFIRIKRKKLHSK